LETEIELPKARRLLCPRCGDLPAKIGVWNLSEIIAGQVRLMGSLHAAGVVGTVKQAENMSEEDVSYQGRAAELAGCCLWCPAAFGEYLRSGKPNRGADLLPEWTGLARPIEIKQTRHRGLTEGGLLLRPKTGKRHFDILEEKVRDYEVEDSFYVVLSNPEEDAKTEEEKFKKLHTFYVDGWADQHRLINEGVLNDTGRPGKDTLHLRPSLLFRPPVGVYPAVVNENWHDKKHPVHHR
jgi:hypothetical protein